MVQLRFGLLGTSYWALNTHGAALVSSPDARLEGVWGRDPAKAADVAGRLGTRAYEDVDQLLAQVDAVAMSLPPDIQATLAVRAAQAGCHLFLEKPLALDVAQAQAVVDAIDAAGTAALVFFTARFRPDVERWTEEAARAGPWHSAHLVKYANIYQPGNPFGASVWRRERGALWDNGPHTLAALLPVMGPVTSVVARRGPSGSDTVHVVLTHGEGSPASPTGTSTVSLSLTMTPGVNTDQLVLYKQGATSTRPEGRFEAADVMGNALGELAAMVENGRRAHRCDPRFALEVTRVLTCAEAALQLPGADMLSEEPPR
jgi:predicted dehydrogenase